MGNDASHPPRPRIGDLAAWAGVSHRTIHYDESLGLLPAPAERRVGGYRSYAPEALERLWLIDRLTNSASRRSGPKMVSRRV